MPSNNIIDEQTPKNKMISSHKSVLDSQRRVFDTRSQMILIKRQLIDNRIDLILALGGTYETE